MLLYFNKCYKGFLELNLAYLYGLNLFNLKALVNTDTELRDMAAAAKIGFNFGPPKR
jgi:hypothetical protein